MKTFQIFGVLAFCGAFLACNTSQDVPQAVQEAFAKNSQV